MTKESYEILIKNASLSVLYSCKYFFEATKQRYGMIYGADAYSYNLIKERLIKLQNKQVQICTRKKVLELMKATNSTQIEIEETTGIRQATISDFITGKTSMNTKTLDKLLNYLNNKIWSIVEPDNL